jgi:hypothetical protein
MTKEDVEIGKLSKDLLGEDAWNWFTNHKNQVIGEGTVEHGLHLPTTEEERDRELEKIELNNLDYAEQKSNENDAADWE